MIEAVSTENLYEILPLIRDYQCFYNVSDISDERNLHFFSQFGPDAKEGCQFLYRDEGKVVATSLDNIQAQKLYDSMNTKKTTWHFYAY